MSDSVSPHAKLERAQNTLTHIERDTHTHSAKINWSLKLFEAHRAREREAWGSLFKFLLHTFMRCSQIAKPALDKQNNFKSVAQYSFGTRQKAAATMTRIPNRPTDGRTDRRTDRGMGRGMDRLAGRQAQQSIACPRPRPAQRPQRRPSRVPVPVLASLGPTTPLLPLLPPPLPLLFLVLLLPFSRFCRFVRLSFAHNTKRDMAHARAALPEACGRNASDRDRNRKREQEGEGGKKAKAARASE